MVLPSVHKHLLCAASAAILGLLPVASAHAAETPRIKTAYTVDGDRDGHVDGVSLRWSTKVRGGRDAKAPFGFSVRGYRVTKVAAAKGTSQRLRLAERPECDTGGSIRVSYSPRKAGRAAMRPAKGRGKVSAHGVDMRRFDPPVPRIVCAITLDTDHDARVDGVRLTYSRAVRNRTQTSGRFLFSVSGYRVTAVRAAKGRFLTIAVAERQGVDSGATPSVGYSRPGRRSQRPYAVRAGSRGDAFSGVFVGTRDGVSPKLLSGRTGDKDRDGLLDSMTLRFSEPVRTPGPGAVGVFGMNVKSVAAGGSGELSLALAEGTARGDARPGAWVADAGVRDMSGNASLRTAVTPADGAAPVMIAAATQDTGGQAGYLDAIIVGFSEPVAHPRDAGGTYPFIVGNRQVTSVEPASGRTVQIKLAEAAAADTGERPSVRLIPGAGLPVADAAGNAAAEGLVNSADAVAPVLLSAATADDNSNGRLDRATLHFSEPVLHGSEPASGSFTVGGYETLQAAAAAGDEIGVGLTEGPTADSGARPAVAYQRDGSEDVRDAAGNTTPSSSIAQAADGAPPVLLAASTSDADDDGRLDGIATSWSEPLVHADDSAAPFPVSAGTATVSRLRAADGTALSVDLTEATGPDTGSVPALSYTGGADPIRDAAGLEPAKTTWAGLTRDALPPRLVSATTGDTDQDGSLDSVALRFSEAVVHPVEATPASFTVAGATVLSAEAADEDVLELVLQESGAGDSGLRPAVTYTPDGQADVLDAAANLAVGGSIAQATDGARPVLRSAATADTDDDGRLDRVTTTWSEALDHADDAAAPFPISAEALAISRLREAAGQTLDVDLVEPAAPDTGSAPDLTYDGGTEPIRDLSGLEAAQRSYPSFTRDALPPRLVATSTGDADFDGKLDAVEIEWSEQVTGATATAPYAVTGRTLGANVTFSGARTRVPFSEDPSQYDTHDTPAVAYDAGPGDLRDVAEGAGDTAEDAPAVATQTPLDKAAPILVAAKTADLSTPALGNTPNGTIDALFVTFSEPISHAVDGIGPFSLNVAGRNETDIEGDSGPTDRTLYARVAEGVTPDGGETPNVSVVSAGPVADRIKDRAATPNEARVMTFTGTADEVRPVLMSAQLGERATGGSCTKAPVDGIDGEIDCVLATWSEEVEHAADAAAPYSISSSGWGIDAAGIGQLLPAKTLEVPLAVAGAKDRDRSGTSVSYDDAVDTPVIDDAAVPNESLPGTRGAEAACRDTGLEGNDSMNVATNPDLETTSPSFQRKCAFDADWYRIEIAAPYLELLTRPVAGVDLDYSVFAENGIEITPTEIVETGAAGQVDRRKYTTGLVAGDAYFVHVTADDTPTPQEGPYCVVFSDDVNDDAGCGPLVGQLVFTEVGLGNDKFLEIKNDFDVPVEMEGSGATVIMGPTNAKRECKLELPTGAGQSMIEPNEHVVVQAVPSATAFGCVDVDQNGIPTGTRTVLPSLDPNGERLELSVSDAIDVVDFAGVISSPIANGHSLQFVEDELVEDAEANNDVDTRWCRTFAADTKGSIGDGCDEYRLNEVLWRPAASAAAADGRAFVEIAGNIPALANSELLAGWVVRGVNGLTGDGTSDFALPAGASPRSNGTYVVADGVAGVSQVTGPDTIWDLLDLQSTTWPDATGTPGPRGLQLLRPNPAGSPPCTGSADSFGWTTTAQGFTRPLDDLRSCPGLEGQEYTHSTVGVSAARDNLSNGGDTSYEENRDTGNNRLDFCPQTVPNPGALNIRPDC